LKVDNGDAVEITEIEDGEEVCNAGAGDVCANAAAATNFTDLDANSRPVAVVGDGKVRVTGAFNNAECIPVTGTELAKGLASDPLSADIGGDSYPLTISQRLFLRCCCKEFQRSLFKKMRLR
jgi:hypothetical protein